MISDWRGDRRIGPASHWEGAGEHLRFAMLAIAVLVAVSIFVTVIRAWGHPLSPAGYIRMGSATFGPNKGRAIVLGLTGGALTAFFWFGSLPVLVALGIVEILPITPVNP